MKPHILIRLLPVFGALCAALALAACADTGYGYYGGGYGRYASGYDAYYDGYYGPYYGGYWGPDNVFVYSRVRGGPYIRDEGHHFRRDGGGAGWRGVHSDRHDRDGDHDRGDHRDRHGR